MSELPEWAFRVDDASDPRLDDYRNLKQRQLSQEGQRFVAETYMVVQRLLQSELTVCSVLLSEARLGTLKDELLVARERRRGRPFVVYVAEQATLDAVVGFPIHRGCVAVAERSGPVAPGNWAALDGARTVVVLEDLVDVDNLGAMVRNAVAFGVDAIVLSPRSADPFYRKAIRVSMGTVFAIPVFRCVDWPADLVALKERLGMRLVAAVLDPLATPLRDYVPPARVALLLGSEGPGLTSLARSVCDDLVTIPVTARADSLNVATAGAVLLYHLTSEGARAR